MAYTNEQIREMVNKANSDYNWKIALSNEGTNFLAMWEASHIGETITPAAFRYYRSLMEESIKRENAARESGRNYKELLIKYGSLYDQSWVSSQIENIDRNEQISYSDQSSIINNYQVIEKRYYNQEELFRLTIGGGLGALGLIILAFALYKLGSYSKKDSKI